MGGMIKKILVANRGEIAVRIIRTARKLGIRTVAVYSKVDYDSLHVSFADEAYCIGDVELSDTYLNIGKIIGVAIKTCCDAIHPGYGFLAENPLFVEAVSNAGITFIGPSADAMRRMGNKIEARAFVGKIGVPVTAGLTGSKKELLKVKEKLSFPVLLKAAAGGGGKGMRIVYDEKELEEAIESTSRQAKAYFGDETVYIEKYLEDPRHIEFQILGDNNGNVIHLFERECSIQRRYQKIIEESPSPTLTPELREKMGEAARKIGMEIGYTNAGTIEFLVDKELNFYFLEMNTRIQVEHPVTEMVLGIDIVEEQIHIASGHELRFRQEDIIQRGHAIECRIYAEDPTNDFRPSPGIMTLYSEPEVTESIRIDKGITATTEIKSSFDPMICKLITWGKERTEASQIMVNALNHYVIHGIRTNIEYLVNLLQTEAFQENRISTGFCDKHTPEIISEIIREKLEVDISMPVISYLLFDLLTRPGNSGSGTGNIWERTGYWRNQMIIKIRAEEKDVEVSVNKIGDHCIEFVIDRKLIPVCRVNIDHHKIRFNIENDFFTAYISTDKENNAFVTFNGHIYTLKRLDILTETEFASRFESASANNDHVTSPMPGKVIKITVNKGDAVKKGDLLLIVEAMKMENKITAPRDGVIDQVNVSVNERVEVRSALVTLEKQ